MKATEQYFPVVLFIILYKNFERVDETLKWNNSNERRLAVQWNPRNLKQSV